MSGLGRDLRHAARGLRKNPSFTLIVVVTLALGIGANSAIFSLMDQVLFRALPVRDPGQLVLLDGPGPFRGRTVNNMTFSYPMYADFRDRNEVLAGALARFQMSMTVGWNGVADRAEGDLVSGNYFEVLGVRPALGRFGGDHAIVNQPISVNGHPFTIVGVAEPGFNGIQVGTRSDVMVPMMMKASMTPTWDDLDNRRSRWVNVMARLKPGITAEQAEVQLNVVYRQANEQEILALENPSESFRKRFVEKHLEVLPGGRGLSDLRRQFSLALIVLMSMVGVVLLIACANIANLLLARATLRQKEFAVRLALGAGRARIVRQQLVESLLLAIAGAMLGLVLARWTGTLLIAALPGSGPADTLSASPDLRVVGFTLVLALLT
jgi:hypothetical protein